MLLILSSYVQTTKNIKNLNDNIFTIQKDSILIEKYISLENIKLKKENGDLKFEKIFSGDIVYSNDSVFKVINLYGEYTGGATYNPYAKHYLQKNNNNLESKLEGSIFRIDKLNKEQYLFYTNHYNRLGNKIFVYKIKIIDNSIVSNLTDSFGNYFFNLIVSKKESYEQLPVFDSKLWNDENLLTILNKQMNNMEPNEYYFRGDDFLKTTLIQDETSENSNLDFLLYYRHKYGDEISKYLRIIKGDTAFDLLLSCSGGDSWTYKVSTEFVNDSIFTSTLINEESYLEIGEKLETKVDSIVCVFKYNKAFDFREIRKDTITYIRKIKQ